MTGIKKVHHGVPAERLIRLKPQKLGRHYHKIPQYICEFSNKHPRIISDYFLRNYRINIELLKVEVLEFASQPEAECVYRSAFGKFGFTIDRVLLSEALECYYGGTCLPNQEQPPESASEQRLRARLGLDIAQLFSRSLFAGKPLGRLEAHDNTYDEVIWEYVAQFKFTSHITGSQGSIYLYLDTDLADELTARLGPSQSQSSPGGSLELVRQLPVRLDCVLASLQMPLSQVLDLRPGDVISLRMGERCDVQINQQKLFRGVIFEDDGSLFLTSLDSVKTP